MANTNKPSNGRSSEDPEPSGEPFDVEEVTKDVAPKSTRAVDEARDGYIHPWNPIPRLKQLLERLIPPRW